MADHIYSILSSEKQEIRLLQLNPALSEDEVLVGHLLKVSLLKDVQYQALSYVCGSNQNSGSILLSEIEVPIYRNLDRALRQIRSKSDVLSLWIDQLSIKQTDTSERNQQVRMMSKIYSSAAAVLAYLDCGINQNHSTNNDLTPGLDVIRRLARCVAQDNWLEFNISESDMFAIWDLFKDPYWNRVWTFQELILASRIIFYFQSQPIQGNTFDVFYKCFTQKFRPDRYGQYAGLAHDILAIAVQAYDHVTILRNKAQSSSHTSLLGLLRYSRRRQATLIHDNIFALTGLSNLPSNIIDYGLSPETIFEQSTTFIIESTGVLDVFSDLTTSIEPPGRHSYQQARSRDGLSDYQCLSSLPSWVPDWSVRVPDGPQLWISERQDLQHFYAASGSTRAQISTPCRGRLQVTGICHGTIAKIGTCYKTPLVFHKGIVESWMQLADIIPGEVLFSDDSGNLRDKRERFIVALSGGLGVTANSSIYLMQNRDQYVAGAFMFAFWWQTRMLCQSEFGFPASFEEQNAINDYYQGADLQACLSAYDCLVRRNSICRRFAVLQDGTFGFVPYTTSIGDKVCVLNGAKTPIILGNKQRGPANVVVVDQDQVCVKKQDMHQEDTHCLRLIGDSYIEGLMSGQRCRDLESMSEFFVLI